MRCLKVCADLMKMLLMPELALSHDTICSITYPHIGIFYRDGTNIHLMGVDMGGGCSLLIEATLLGEFVFWAL